MKVKKLFALSLLALLPLTACDKNPGTNPGGDPGGEGGEPTYVFLEVLEDISQSLFEESYTTAFDYDSTEDVYIAYCDFEELENNDEGLETATESVMYYLPEYLEIVFDIEKDTWEEGDDGYFATLATSDDVAWVDLGSYWDTEYNCVSVQVVVYELGEDPDVPVLDGDTIDRYATGVAAFGAYADWTLIGESGAEYAGNSGGGDRQAVEDEDGALQFRSKNSNSGIVTTVSGGIIASITIVWNAGTTVGRKLDVYGSNTDYEAPNDLYNSSKQGSKINTFEYDGSTLTVTFTVSGNYTYVGVRSNNGALYLDSIAFEWTPAN